MTDPRRLHVHLEHAPDDRELVGTLGELDRGIAFEYDPAFVRAGRSLSPFKLQLAVGLQVPDAARALHGLFEDSLPDYWGRIVMDRHFTRLGRDPRRTTALDRLAYLGRRCLGALTYHPCSEPDTAAEPLDLSQAAAECRAIYEGSVTDMLPVIRRAAGSAGGARPKILVGIRGDNILSGADDLPDTHEPWLLKFTAPGEDRYCGLIEFIYSDLARAAGIDMPETRLFTLARNERCFGVRRFDRQGAARRHMHTLANLLHVDIHRSTLDYRDLLEVVVHLTRNDADVRECFRRMVFNLLTHNRDDHAKNFAFLMDRNGEWRLSPAYDLTFVEGPGGEHWMSFHGEGRTPTWHHLRQLGTAAGLELRTMLQILDQVRAGVARWTTAAKATKLPAAHIRDIDRRLARVAADAALPPATASPAKRAKRP